ncbi:mechanosensitive ion channel [Phenylobacterium sp.]|uniref:mechanosensitive ion channel n=1 Tax=Phenylobacterium sp. TaxID=1871053 RepID=UPI002810B59C|nr:mechanosensitive ion channel [Phenylobacterium sp.]
MAMLGLEDREDAMPTLDYYRSQQMMMDWGPRIAIAIVILIAAHFLAKAAQWGLARLIDRIPGVKQHNAGADPKETVGYQLGQLAYWLVLLIGLIGALTTLELTSIVAPLNGLLLEVAAFIPNLIGAVVIFFVGFIVATLARRVVEAGLAAARLDSWLEKAGLSRVTGASGLSRTVGTLVFVLIIIPVTIAALQQLGVSAISDPAVAVLATVLDALPRVLAAAIVLAIAFVIGRWVASLIEQLLPSLGFDRSLQGLGIGPAAEEPLEADAAAQLSRITPSKVVARLALVAIMLFSAVEAARLLAFAAIAVMLAEILELAGHVLFGGVIIAIGVITANFLAALIDRSTNGADGFASDIVKWATIALATAMGLRFMGIADEIVILAFGLILGSAAVAAALAFGIGGRDAAARLLEKWTKKPPQ